MGWTTQNTIPPPPTVSGGTIIQNCETFYFKWNVRISQDGPRHPGRQIHRAWPWMLPVQAPCTPQTPCGLSGMETPHDLSSAWQPSAAFRCSPMLPMWRSYSCDKTSTVTNELYAQCRVACYFRHLPLPPRSSVIPFSLFHPNFDVV